MLIDVAPSQFDVPNEGLRVAGGFTRRKWRRMRRAHNRWRRRVGRVDDPCFTFRECECDRHGLLFKADSPPKFWLASDAEEAPDGDLPF